MAWTRDARPPVRAREPGPFHSIKPAASRCATLREDPFCYEDRSTPDAACDVSGPVHRVAVKPRGVRIGDEGRRPVLAFCRADYDQALATVRATLGAPVFDRCWREGRGLSLAEAIAYALAESSRSQDRSRQNQAGLKPSVEE